MDLRRARHRHRQRPLLSPGLRRGLGSCVVLLCVVLLLLLSQPFRSQRATRQLAEENWSNASVRALSTLRTHGTKGAREEQVQLYRSSRLESEGEGGADLSILCSWELRLDTLFSLSSTLCDLCGILSCCA